MEPEPSRPLERDLCLEDLEVALHLSGVCAKNGDWHRVSPAYPCPRANLRAKGVPVPAFRLERYSALSSPFLGAATRHERLLRRFRRRSCRRVSRPVGVAARKAPAQRASSSFAGAAAGGMSGCLEGVRVLGRDLAGRRDGGVTQPVGSSLPARSRLASGPSLPFLSH